MLEALNVSDIIKQGGKPNITYIIENFCNNLRNCLTPSNQGYTVISTDPFLPIVITKMLTMDLDNDIIKIIKIASENPLPSHIIFKDDQNDGNFTIITDRHTIHQLSKEYFRDFIYAMLISGVKFFDYEMNSFTFHL